MILWLIGMMGVGKTSAGRLAAESLDVGFVDTDEQVIELAGQTIAEIWASHGEGRFRQVESQAIRTTSARSDEHLIVATGGGAVVLPENRAEIRESGRVLWLRAGPETLATRVTAGDARPLLGSAGGAADTIQTLLTQRSALYSDLADEAIDVGMLSREESANEIGEVWNRLLSG